MSGPRQVVLTGMGFVTPIGMSAAQVLESLRVSRSGIREWRSEALRKPFPAGTVQAPLKQEFTKLELPYLDRCSQMAILAARQAIAEAGLSDFGEDGLRAGVYYGTVRGGAQTEEAWGREFHVEGRQTARPYTLMASMLNAAPAHVSMRHKITGPVQTYSCACASSAAAIGEAFLAIRDGRIDVAVAGGAEAPLVPSMVAVWDTIRALAPAGPEGAARSCRPFAKSRAGLVLAEGAVFLVLERADRAASRGHPAYCQLSGYGIASDAHHIVLPHAEGQARALGAALADAKLRPEDIDYFNAHATATLSGDPVEVQAIRSVFAQCPPVSSTKAIHGHLLGAAGAMELAATVLAVRHSFLPATAHLDQPSDDCALNHVANASVLDHPLRHALSFSAGFGGTNVALIVSAIS